MKQKKVPKTTNSTGFTAFLITTTIFLLASLFPIGRVWGINWWAYYPPLITITIALVTMITGFGLSKWLAKPVQSVESSNSSFKYWIYAGIVATIVGAGMVLLPSKTHFLGDGYQLLGRLAEGTKSVKAWDFGASIIHDLVFNLLPSDIESRALRTFQIVSVGFGLIVLIASMIYSRIRFQDFKQQLAMFLGLISGGFLLLFFGYVENYAGLTMSVLLCALLGDLSMREKLKLIWPIWPVLAFMLALFFHLFAVFLTPAILYLVFRNSVVGERLKNLNSRTRLSLGLGTVLTGLVIYFVLRESSLFFTFAFLPLIPDRFTVDSDTILSIKHMLDLANLILILIPGSILFIATIGINTLKIELKNKSSLFLMIMFGTLFLPPLMLNAGIGVPRNWDLFSLMGIPLVVWLFSVILESSKKNPKHFVTACLMVLLGFSMLIPRVMAQYTPKIAIAHFENYLELDPTRNRNSASLLIDYYKEHDDPALAEKLHIKITNDFPEISWNSQAKQLMNSGRYNQAIKRYQRVIEANPLYVEAYANWGNCLLVQGQLDSALQLLQLADGMNPYNVNTITNIGTVYLRQKKQTEALDNFRLAYSIDSSSENLIGGMAAVYLQLKQYDSSLVNVKRMFLFEDISYSYFQQAGDGYLGAGAIAQAREAYSMAMSRGLDSSYVKKLYLTHPQLKP